MKKLLVLGCVLILFGLIWVPCSVIAATISATDDVGVGRYIYWPEPNYTYYDNESDWRMSTGSYYGSSNNYHYLSYLQFDLSEISDDFDLSSAVLNLYIFSGGTQSPYVYYIPDDSWDESSINWNNRPSTGGQIAEQVNWDDYPDYEWVEIPLINWDYQTDLNDDTLSIVLAPWASGGYGPTTYYATQDYSDGSFVATLDLTGDDTAPVPEPATMLLLGSGLIGLAGFGRRFKKS